MTRYQLLTQLAQVLINEANSLNERFGSPARLCPLKEMHETAFNAEIGFVKAICAALAKADMPTQALLDAGGAVYPAMKEAQIKPGDEWGPGDIFVASFRGFMKSLAEAEITRDDWPLLPLQMASELISSEYPNDSQP